MSRSSRRHTLSHGGSAVGRAVAEWRRFGAWIVARYRTEIVIPRDRVLIIHLPDDLPEGAATLLVESASLANAPMGPTSSDDDREDIEWWENLDDSAVEKPSRRNKRDR